MSEFKDQVNELVGKMVKGDDGNWALPEEAAKDVDESTMYAVTSERRYRDTQGAYTKAQQNFKKEQAVSMGLQERLLTSEISLTKEQKYELNELRKTDPEAWRTKLNEYETANKANLSTELEEIRVKSSTKGELEIRKDQMAAFSEETGIVLTDEVVAHDLPPRFLKELEKGKVTFEQFLVKAGNFIKAEKMIQGADEDTDDDTKDLSKVAGGQEPSEQAQRGDFVETYETTIF
jgi:hypothetical protein